MEKLNDLLVIEANRINLEFNDASISGRNTPSDVSDRREPHVSTFIQKYFPYPYRVAKGRIIDSFGKESNSIDCILLNPIHPYTVHPVSDEYAVILADGVDACIEVKPKLEGDEINRALHQVRSIKKLRRVNSSVWDDVANDEMRNYSKQITSFIFSTTTYVDIRLLIEKIVIYYEDNPAPKSEQFDYIVINQRCIIYNARHNSVVNNSRDLIFHEEGIYIINHNEKTLFHFLHRLNAVYPSVIPLAEPAIFHYLRFNYLSECTDIVCYDDLSDRLLAIK